MIFFRRTRFSTAVFIHVQLHKINRQYTAFALVHEFSTPSQVSKAILEGIIKKNIMEAKFFTDNLNFVSVEANLNTLKTNSLYKAALEDCSL